MRFLAIAVLLAACGGHHGNGDDANGNGDGSSGGPVIVQCPGCPTFPGLGSGSACSGSAADPQLVYPPDGTLLPPNMNVIDTHFMPGAGNAIFEIDFENAVTDVRLETQCNMVTNTRGDATGGCAFTLDPNDWNFVSQQNKGGDPVTITVRAAPQDLSCVSSSNSRQISFATEDMTGGIYYWQSVTQNGVAGTTGGIFRKDFGDPSPTSEPFLTPGNADNKCVGCHYLSRDGLKMVYGSDDADSDDELGDDHFVVYDVTNRTAGGTNLLPGFIAWQGTAHDGFLRSDGRGKDNAVELVPADGTTGKDGIALKFTGVAGLTGKRLTNPDWSRDGNTVYFTATTPITGITGYTLKDDIHATNGSIWSAPFAAGALGTPTELVTPANASENDYYPTISPDGNTVVFNRAVTPASDTSIGGTDSYNNPHAALFAIAAAGGTPISLDKANDKADLTNSWPRFAPVVQNYKGKHLLWITFSSTRDYGLVVQNENPPSGPTVNCYPPVSPEDTSGDHKKPFAPNCTQPQIWMAAIVLEDLANGDSSFPAFWLPFQDSTAHNHIAQWVDTVVTTTGCADVGQDCTTATCCNGLSCDPTTHTCGAIIF